MANTNLGYRIIDADFCAINSLGECTSKKIVIPDEIDGRIVREIESNAFTCESQIVEGTIPNTVIAIGNTAFYNCKNLKKVVIPEETYRVGEHAFGFCTSLTSIVLGRIGQLDWFSHDVFYGCDKIKNIEIANGNTNGDRP